MAVEVQHEDWHWKMAVASMFLGVVGALAVYTFFNTPWADESQKLGFAPYLIGGAVAVPAAIYAGWVSRFWNRVRHLGQPQKSVVWTIAIVGFAAGFIFVLAFVIAMALWSSLNSRD